jgi:hypothetical protein
MGINVKGYGVARVKREIAEACRFTLGPCAHDLDLVKALTDNDVPVFIPYLKCAACAIACSMSSFVSLWSWVKWGEVGSFSVRLSVLHATNWFIISWARKLALVAILRHVTRNLSYNAKNVWRPDFQTHL